MRNSNKEDPFVNSEGDHVYYDRALIEKKEFQRRHPEVKDVRTLRSLLSHNSYNNTNHQNH